jgi:hypothetical protein
MKTTLFALLLAACSTVAYSKEPRVINIPAICLSSDAMAKLLVEFDEQPSLTMITTREGVDGKTARHQTLLFINYETKSWSLVEKLDSGEFCIVGVGEKITPYIKKK